MVVVSETADPDLSYVLRSRGVVRRFVGGSLLLLALVVPTSKCFCGITFEVIPGFGTSRAVCPPLSSKVLSQEKFPQSFGLP